MIGAIRRRSCGARSSPTLAVLRATHAYYQASRRQRSFVLSCASDWTDFVEPNGLPVVVALHDAGDTAEDTAQQMGFTDLPLAPAPGGGPGLSVDKCVVIYPQARRLGVLGPDWDAGYNRPDSDKNDTTDVDYIYQVLAEAERLIQLPYDQRVAAGNKVATTSGRVFDPDKILLVGMGTGGMMALRVTASTPNPDYPFAAVAVVNGAIGGFQHAVDQADLAHQVLWQPLMDSAVFWLRTSLDDTVANEVLPATNAALPSGNGDISLASGEIYAAMNYPASVGAIEQTSDGLARLDFNMPFALDVWAEHMFEFQNMYSSATAVALTPNTVIIAFDAGGSVTAGNSNPSGGAIPAGARLVGIVVNDNPGVPDAPPSHRWPNNCTGFETTQEIWNWFKTL